MLAFKSSGIAVITAVVLSCTSSAWAQGFGGLIKSLQDAAKQMEGQATKGSPDSQSQSQQAPMGMGQPSRQGNAQLQQGGFGRASAEEYCRRLQANEVILQYLKFRREIGPDIQEFFRTERMAAFDSPERFLRKKIDRTIEEVQFDRSRGALLNSGTEFSTCEETVQGTDFAYIFSDFAATKKQDGATKRVMRPDGVIVTEKTVPVRQNHLFASGGSATSSHFFYAFFFPEDERVFNTVGKEWLESTLRKV